jgi:hypothetical protein
MDIFRAHIYEAHATLRTRKSFVRQPVNNRVYGPNNIDLRGNLLAGSDKKDFRVSLNFHSCF